MLSRRQFLERSTLISLSPFVPCVLASAARAATAQRDAKTLVVIQLDGGNDGINTVVPHGDDGYGRARDKLRLETDKLLKLDDHVALHPRMQAAKELYDDARLAIVQGVGYPNPNRSHFRSMKIWQTARFDEEAHDQLGWLGRALDRAPAQQSGAEPGAIYVGHEEVPVAVWGRRSVAVALARIDDLLLELPPEQVKRMITAQGPARTDSAALDQFVERQLLAAYTSAESFERQRKTHGATPAAKYPGSKLGSRLQLISQLLKSGSAARVFYTAQGGYDTHAAQLYTHARLVREFSAALKAFLDDLRSAGLDERVVVLAFSEFGRRVKENASQGTDHGTAGPVFLAGPSVRGGLVGVAPDLSDLDSGDLKMSIDFRQVYATVLDDWLEVASQDVLGAVFEPLPLFERA